MISKIVRTSQQYIVATAGPNQAYFIVRRACDRKLTSYTQKGMKALRPDACTLGGKPRQENRGTTVIFEQEKRKMAMPWCMDVYLNEEDRTVYLQS